MSTTTEERVRGRTIAVILGAFLFSIAAVMTILVAFGFPLGVCHFYHFTGRWNITFMYGFLKKSGGDHEENR